jgi:hypothetical protein
MSLRISRPVRDHAVVRAEGAGRRKLALLLLVTVAAGGCSKQETGSQTTTIGAAGGTVTADDSRARLEIPAGALSAPTAIQIIPASSSRTGLLPGMAYDFQPDGLVFAKPATLTLHPPSGVTLDAQSLIVHVIGNAVQFDDSPSVDVTAQTVSAQLSGFSTHAGASVVTLCPEGCPSVPTVTATAVQAGYIELTGSCSANGRGTTTNLVVERAFVPALSSVLSDFQNWSTDVTFAAPPSNVEGGCSYVWDDHDVCLGWTYAYRVRANALATTTNASNIALAIGPGTRQCTAPGGGGDGGTPDAGSGGSGTVTVHTYLQAGSQKPVPTNAAWVGGQDGSGAFVPLTGQAGLYSFDVHDASGRYGVAVACTAGTPADGRIIQATTIEGTDVHLVCRGPAPATAATSVTTLNCSNATYSFGSSTVLGGSCGTSSQSLESGVHDVVGVSKAGTEFVRVLVEHDVSGPSLTLDFQGSGSASAVAHQVKVAANGTWLYSFQTPGGLFLWLSSPGTGNYPGVPASVRGPDDIHSICTVDINNPTRTGYICHYFKDPVDVDDSTAPYAARPSPTGDKTQVSWSPYLASGFDVAIASYRIWLSIGWLGQTNSYTYPRLCGLTGFPLPCVDATTDTQYAFRAYKPAEGFAASLVDIQNAESLPAAARDGLTYAVALTVGSL